MKCWILGHRWGLVGLLLFDGEPVDGNRIDPRERPQVFRCKRCHCVCVAMPWDNR